MADPTGYFVMCVHSTRRTRAQASPGAKEVRCHGCRATILLSASVPVYAREHGVDIYPVCPVCTIASADPDEVVADAMTIMPDTIEVLRSAGCEDPEGFMARQGGRTIHDFARCALQNTVGGQG